MTILLTFSWIQSFSSFSLTRWPKGAGLQVRAEWRGGVLPLVGWLPLIYYFAVGAREPAGLQALCASHQCCWPQPWHSRESSPGTGLCIYPSGVPWSCCGFTHQVLSLCTAQGGANLVRRLCVTPGPRDTHQKGWVPGQIPQGLSGLWVVSWTWEYYVEGF